MRYVLLALLVTFLWSSSFVIIKLTLASTTPLIFAGYRYLVASVLLFVVILTNSSHRNQLNSLGREWWVKLLVYGIIFIFVTQGAGYLTLTRLPAITLSFTLNFSAVFVVVFGYIFLGEKTTGVQFTLIMISIIGAFVYFYPLDLQSDASIGYLYVLIALFANVAATIQGRSINREREISPIIVTGVSMMIGSVLLLSGGLWLEGFQVVNATVMLAVLWLGVINTALAFTIWNKVMQYLEAFEASIILNTMLPQITILSIIFLDEQPTLSEWIGLIIIVISVTLVQYVGIRNISPKD